MAENEAFPRNWLVMENFFFEALDHSGDPIMHTTRTEGVAGLSNQVVEETKAMRHNWRGEIVQFDSPEQVPRTRQPVQKVTPSGEPELEPDGAGGYRYLYEQTSELTRAGQRKKKMRDAGVTKFKPLTNEEAERLGRMNVDLRLEQKLYHDDHPLSWMGPQEDEPSTNGVEASTSEALSTESRAQLRIQASEIKKLKADLARSKKNEKLVSGRLASEMKQLATANSNRQLPKSSRDS